MRKCFIPTPDNPAKTVEQLCRLEMGRIYIDNHGYYWLKTYEGSTGFTAWHTPAMEGVILGDGGIVEVGGVMADQPTEIVDYIIGASELAEAVELLRGFYDYCTEAGALFHDECYKNAEAYFAKLGDQKDA